MKLLDGPLKYWGMIMAFMAAIWWVFNTAVAHERHEVEQDNLIAEISKELRQSDRKQDAEIELLQTERIIEQLRELQLTVGLTPKQEEDLEFYLEVQRTYRKRLMESV